MNLTPTEARKARSLADAEYRESRCDHRVALARWHAVDEAIRGLEKNNG